MRWISRQERAAWAKVTSVVPKIAVAFCTGASVTLERHNGVSWSRSYVGRLLPKCIQGDCVAGHNGPRAELPKGQICHYLCQPARAGTPNFACIYFSGGCAFRRMVRGGWPNARRKARRIRSLSAKPVSCATTSIECALCSSISLAASTRRFSTAFAGDWPVSARKVRLNCRGLSRAASASCSTVRSLRRFFLA